MHALAINLLIDYMVNAVCTTNLCYTLSYHKCINITQLKFQENNKNFNYLNLMFKIYI